MKYLKYIIGILIVLIPCVLTILIYNDKITQNSPLYYKQGVTFYNNGDYSNAYYNFGKIKWISPLYPMALYKQAKSAQNLGDFKTASIKYKLFLDKVPASVFALNAKINLGKCYFYSKQYEEAKLLFEELYSDNDVIGTEKIFFLALVEKRNDKAKSANYFREYLKSSIYDTSDIKQNTEYLYSAAEELAALNVDLSNDDRKLLGIAYYKNQKYKQALEFFVKIPVIECWDYLVLANHYSGNKIIAKKLIENGLSTYASIIDEGNLHEIYDIYASYMVGSKIKNWMQIYKTVKDNSLKGQDYVMYKLANILPSDKALVIYKEIVEKYPESNYAPESLWKLFWNKYKNKDYSGAELLAVKHLKTYKAVKSTPKVGFWLAKTELKQNKISEANNHLSKLAAKYPDDYYGLRAENILMKKENFWQADNNETITIQKNDIEFPISFAHIDIKDLKLINTLFDLGDYEIWLDADFNNPIVESWFEYKKGKKSRSIVLTRNQIEKMDIKPPFASSAYKLAFPIYYGDEINISAKKLGLDPYLVISLIKEESYFNEYAISKSNAIGLMQLIPSTANYMISKLGIDMSVIEKLNDPRTNMYIGCNYLKYLKDRFNDDLMVIAAYNGGEGSVAKWMKSYNVSDYDEFIESIPFDETQNYVKKVFRTYHMYKKIYK